MFHLKSVLITKTETATATWNWTVSRQTSTTAHSSTCSFL